MSNGVQFKDFNFKLAVIEGLMYEQGVLAPRFDVYEFVKDYAARQIDIADELAYDEDFWRNVDVDVLPIADPELRAFVHYALNKPVAPVYASDRCLYMEGLLDDLPNHRFVIGWEARAPRQDVAYAILHSHR